MRCCSFMRRLTRSNHWRQTLELSTGRCMDLNCLLVPLLLGFRNLLLENFPVVEFLFQYPAVFCLLQSITTFWQQCVGVISGMGPDSRVLVRKSRKQAQTYQRLYQVWLLQFSCFDHFVSFIELTSIACFHDEFALMFIVALHVRRKLFLCHSWLERQLQLCRNSHNLGIHAFPKLSLSSQSCALYFTFERMRICNVLRTLINSWRDAAEYLPA